ncbi:MAG: hypothetical protein NC191_04490 [Muribaculaceae bacterium]|nr:hypothetical protein [Muribaculaceae bacterium]
MVKITKDGITKFVPEKELQHYTDLGFKKAGHKPEPMVIEEPKGDEVKDGKAKGK